MQPLQLRTLAAAALLLGAGGCAAPAAAPTPEAAAPAAAAAATITPDDMYRRIAFLASDELAGRDTPSPGLESAARYIAEQFASFGLEPAGEDGTFLQRYPLPLRALDTTSVHFGAVIDGENRMLRYGVDFFAAAAEPRPGVDMFHGGFVYAGELADALPPGPSLDAQVVVVGLPGDYDREWRIAAARARRMAEDAGATALLVVLDPAFPAEAVARLAAAASEPRRGLVNPNEIPVFYMTREAAGRLLGWGGFDLATAPERPATRVAIPGLNAHFAAEAATIEAGRPPNVAAVLRGSDPELRDSYVVFSAHMDHVGVGRPDASGDSIYNGADDDASGTAALLEVAQAFAALPQPPARSLLFLAVSGEEKGLLGSRWFSDHPTVPLEGIVANVNVDMIGRNSPDSIVVIGMDYSSLGPLVKRVAAERPVGLTVSDDLWPEERFFFRSDHFNFARKEIPALFFFAGVHDDYHRPSDEVDKIDTDKAARVARLIFYTAYELAEARERPVWVPAGLEEVRALTR